jgi:hypothetical protein
LSLTGAMSSRSSSVPNVLRAASYSTIGTAFCPLRTPGLNAHTHTHTHTQRERDRDSERETERDREREREPSRTHTYTKRDRYTHTHTHTHTHPTHTERERPVNSSGSMGCGHRLWRNAKNTRGQLLVNEPRMWSRSGIRWDNWRVRGVCTWHGAPDSMWMASVDANRQSRAEIRLATIIR